MAYKKLLLLFGLSLIFIFAVGNNVYAANISNVIIDYNSTDKTKLDITYQVTGNITGESIIGQCGSTKRSLIPSVDRGSGYYTDVVYVGDFPELQTKAATVKFYISCYIDTKDWRGKPKKKMETVSKTFFYDKPIDVVDITFPNGMKITVKKEKIEFINPLTNYISGKATSSVRQAAVSTVFGALGGKVTNKVWGIFTFSQNFKGFSRKELAWQTFAFCMTTPKPIEGSDVCRDNFWECLDEDIQASTSRSGIDDPNLTMDDIETTMINGPWHFRYVYVQRGLAKTAIVISKAVGFCY